jgi:hypothetical protein
MAHDDRTTQLLEEIRDATREHLAEFRRVTQQSLDMQRRAVERQEQMAGVYRRNMIVGGALVGGLILLLVYLLSRWGHVLFR